MVTGQAAATAAVMAIDLQVPVQQVDVKKLQERLKKDPLVNGKPVEVLVDNDDKERVTVNGEWVTVRGGYGRDLFLNKGKMGSDMSVKYRPQLEHKGKYGVYIYLPKIENVASTINFNVFDGKKNRVVSIKPAEIKQLGLTSGEWAELGTYELAKGQNAFVEVTTTGGSGEVIADAVIFKPL